MGNEGSIPQSGEDEFESQARAPPSATHPASSGAKSHPSSATGGGGGGGPQLSTRSGRMINAVFHRRQNNSANHVNHHPSEYHSQPGAPPMQPEDMVMMSPEQQQKYYQEQEQLYQQQQQQYYNSGGQTPYNSSNAKTASEGVMYASKGPPQGSNNTTPSKGKGFRSSGRAGAAILNSMKNLSLGAGVLGRSSRGGGGGTTTKEWETKWDEDEDDSDGEDDSLAKMPAHQGAVAPGATASDSAVSATTMSPMLRPAMEAGLSSPPPITSATPTLPPAVGAAASMPPANSISATKKAHLVTATPEQPGRSKEDGIEWDTGALASDTPDYEKPNVQMFLPLLRVLGKGSFGKVVLCQKRVGKERGQLFAMKILRKSYLVKRRQIERTRTERKVLSVVNHPFIMKLHYAFQTPDKLYLVLDYCPGGELFFHLSRFRRFPERVARFYAAELLLALGHLHKRGIIYRDLKPENVLLDAEGHVKLGDFGLAKAGIQHACEGATSMCGTPEYMAPEVLAQQGHGFCVDYWGLGMLVYEMMTGLPPWYTTDRTRLFRRLKSAPLDIPTYFSQSSANCVSALLERNPRRRLGVTGIRAAMEHEFFRSISWRALYGRRIEAPIRPCEGWSPPGATTDDSTGAEPPMNGEDPDLDAATANFDNTFTRMPVETDDHPEARKQSDSEDLEELHEDTFVGFTFDDNERDEIASMQQQQQQQQQGVAQRQRTHHLSSTNGERPAVGQVPQATSAPIRHLD